MIRLSGPLTWPRTERGGWDIAPYFPDADHVTIVRNRVHNVIVRLSEYWQGHQLSDFHFAECVFDADLDERVFFDLDAESS